MISRSLQPVLLILVAGALGLVSVAMTACAYLYYDANSELKCRNAARLEFDALVTTLLPELAAVAGSVANVNSCDSTPRPGTLVVVDFQPRMNDESALEALKRLGWEDYVVSDSVRRYMKSPGGELYVEYHRDGAAFGTKENLGAND